MKDNELDTAMSVKCKGDEFDPRSHSNQDIEINDENKEQVADQEPQPTQQNPKIDDDSADRPDIVGDANTCDEKSEVSDEANECNDPDDIISGVTENHPCDLADYRERTYRYEEEIDRSKFNVKRPTEVEKTVSLKIAAGILALSVLIYTAFVVYTEPLRQLSVNFCRNVLSSITFWPTPTKLPPQDRLTGPVTLAPLPL